MNELLWQFWSQVSDLCPALEERVLKVFTQSYSEKVNELRPKRGEVNRVRAGVSAECSKQAEQWHKDHELGINVTS